MFISLFFWREILALLLESVSVRNQEATETAFLVTCNYKKQLDFGKLNKKKNSGFSYELSHNYIIDLLLYTSYLSEYLLLYILYITYHAYSYVRSLLSECCIYTVV